MLNAGVTMNIRPVSNSQGTCSWHLQLHAHIWQPWIRHKCCDAYRCACIATGMALCSTPCWHGLCMKCSERVGSRHPLTHRTP
jgi:hypothetical protein